MTLVLLPFEQFLLLKAGADPTAKDALGQTAYDMAKGQNKTKFLKAWDAIVKK
jgi:ankyrin repeat protein